MAQQTPYPGPQYGVPPKRSRGPVVLVIALGLVLVAVLATATVLILRGRDDKPTAAAGSKQPRNQLAIVVGDKVVSAPSVNAPIIAGKVQIAGNLTQKDAEKLAADITG